MTAALIQAMSFPYQEINKCWHHQIYTHYQMLTIVLGIWNSQQPFHYFTYLAENLQS